MPPIDPSQLLKALGPLLTNNGGIKGAQEASRIISLMKDATKLVNKCIYLNILRGTSSQEALEKFIAMGGWDTLNDWLHTARSTSNEPLVGELLEVYLNLPVTVLLLKQNSTAKTIKQLRKKATDDKIQKLSTVLVDRWTQIIREQNNIDQEAEEKKKKKKQKEREKDRDKDKDKEKEREKDKERKDREKDSDKSRDKEKDSKNHQHDKDRDKDRREREKSRTKDKEREKDREKDRHKDKNRHTSSTSSGSKSDNNVNGLSDPGKEDESRKRPKTVKQYGGRFRSTGLFDEDDHLELEPVKKKLDKPVIKRPVLDKVEDMVVEKKPRLQLSMPSLNLSGVDGSINSTTPEITHGRIKIIPPKRAPGHGIHESDVFMDALQKSKSSYTHGAIKRKKKLTSPTTTSSGPSLLSSSIAVTSSPPSIITSSSQLSGPGQEARPTSPPLLSPTTAMAQKLPSVPSFYRDTLDDLPDTTESEKKNEEEEENEEEKDESPPHLENMEIDEGRREISEEMETTEAGEWGSTLPSLPSVEEEMLQEESSPAERPDKIKKSVTWASDLDMVEVFYFELDETERENVNRPKSFNQMKKEEMMMDRRAMDAAKRLVNDNMVEVLQWKHPKLIDSAIMVVDPGCNSKEKEIQMEREKGVLCALFFNKVPDTPIEPDPDIPGEQADTKLIPLEDENGSCTEYEHTYNQTDPSSLPYDPEFDQPMSNQGPGPGGMGPGGPNSNSGGGPMSNGMGANMKAVGMPPALNHLLNTLQQQAHETRDPVMANLQVMLSSVLQNTNPQDGGLLMERILNALEPFRNQIPGLSNLINSITNGSMDNNGGGSGLGGPRFMGQPVPPGPMGGPVPRHGLLGPHPPGFNMMPGGGVGGGSMRPPPMQGPGPSPGPMMGGGGGAGGNPNFFMGNPGGPGPVPNMDKIRMGGPPPHNQWRGGGRRQFNKRGRSQICQHFIHKGCKYGDSCSFIHPTGGPNS